MEYYGIHGWEEHQPPEARAQSKFIRNWTDLINNPKYFNLTAAARGILHGMWLYRGLTGRNPPVDQANLRAILRLPPGLYVAKCLESLELRGFIKKCRTQSRSDKSKTRKTPLPPRELGVVDSDGFTRFWDSYPRKVGKAAARKAWEKLRLEPRSDRIVVAVTAQRSCPQWRKDQGQFIPHPTTWLNQGRWDDEVGTPNTSGITEDQIQIEMARMDKERQRDERLQEN